MKIALKHINCGIRSSSSKDMKHSILVGCIPA
jgi:hypothetical protein